MRARTILDLATLAIICLTVPSAAEEAAPPPQSQPSPQSTPDSSGRNAPPSSTAEEPSILVLGSRQVQSVLGREVRSSSGEDMGRIVDIIVDHSGQVRAAVIDFGGFLGVGSRKIAVDWNALNFSPDPSRRDTVALELSRDQVKAAPEYKEKQTVIVLGVAGVLQPLPDE